MLAMYTTYNERLDIHVMYFAKHGSPMDDAIILDIPKSPILIKLSAAKNTFCVFKSVTYVCDEATDISFMF